MIAKKDWVADGNTSRFLPDIIVRTEDFARVYAYVYDINGVDGQLQTPSLPFKYPTNLYIRTNNVPTSADIITIDNWDLVNNNISFYSKPLSGTTVWIEVATTTEELGETLTQPAVKRAEDAAIASELSATNASNSASTATAQATIATTQASTATSQATIASTKASEASVSETNAATSATNSATSATASAASATASATSASDSAASATASSVSATASANNATSAANSASSSFTYSNNASTSASNAATSETNAGTSEANALTYSNNASASATNARQSADDALQSEINAEQSYQNVLNYDILSEGYKNDALNSATSASNSATSALSSATTAVSARTAIESYVIPTEATYSTSDIDKKINALAPYSGYTQVSKKLDNFVFQTSSNFLNKVADKNRFVKFGDKVVDTYTHSSYDATKGGVVAQFTVPEVSEIVAEASGVTTVQVNKGNYVIQSRTVSTDHTATTFRAKQDAPIGTALTNTTYFEDRTELGVTNQALAYHAYNTLTNSYEGIKTETLFSDVSKEDLLDNPTWLARNGFSKVSDFLYSKGSYLVLPVGIWQSLNKGAYHPVFNPFGTTAFRAITENDFLSWYPSNVYKALSVADCINQGSSGITFYNGFIGYNNVGSVTATNISGSAYTWSPRPDSKYYDITYSDQFIDVREYAKVLNNYEVDVIRDDKEDNGVEEATVTKKYDYDFRPAPTAVGISKTSSFDGYDYREDKLYIVANGIGFIVEKADMLFVAPNTTISNTYSRFAELRSALIASGISEYTWGKATASASVSTKPILSSNTKLSIDLIGSPSVYPQILKDRLASGVGVVGINPLLVGQDGTSYVSGSISAIYSDKYISGKQVVYQTISTGAYTLWTLGNIGTINNTSETVQDVSLYNFITSYTSKNLPYIQTTPKPVIEVEPKVIASNSHSIYKGALVGNQVSGKIQVGNGSNGYESKVLENSMVREYDVYLDVLKQTSVNTGDKVVIYNNNYADDGQLAIRVGSSFNTIVGATSNIANDGVYWAFIGKLQIPSHSTIALDNSNSPASKWFETLEEGDNGVLAGVYGEELIYDTGFGDDDTFEQLTNGTITDLNGNTCRTFKGSLPINGKVK